MFYFLSDAQKINNYLYNTTLFYTIDVIAKSIGPGPRATKSYVDTDKCTM